MRWGGGRRTFWVVLAGATSTDAPELWTVSTLGTAQLVGAYPAIPTGFTAYASGRLDSAGALFSEGRDVSGSFVDVIVRRTVGATSDVIYTEADNPLVKLHISALVTGP